ncbi:MAG TPA: rod shape-determining protein MreD [Candidatus Omnitrophota bacterium]|nr:rod shape-determining protein MreD [Candidatus Omnitrophota bacterium]HPS20003.1 rod shape-determining protein MreD [Candidatus Omnitrophota bacterium]
MRSVDERQNIFVLSLVLFTALFIQVHVLRYYSWLPDLVLLVVVFAGVHGGSSYGLIAGFAGGIARGLFSVYLLPIDVFVFPTIGIIAAVVSRMFNKDSAVTQLLVTAAAMFFLIFAHIMYLKVVSDNNLMLAASYAKSWKSIIVTVIVAPFVYSILKEFWRIDE